MLQYWEQKRVIFDKSAMFRFPRNWKMGCNYNGWWLGSSPTCMPSLKYQLSLDVEVEKTWDSIWSQGQSGHSSHFQQRFVMEQHEDESRNNTRLCVQILGSEGF